MTFLRGIISDLGAFGRVLRGVRVDLYDPGLQPSAFRFSPAHARRCWLMVFVCLFLSTDPPP